MYSYPILVSVDDCIIGTASGRFVSHIYHRQHKSPVYMILSENWPLVILFSAVCVFHFIFIVFAFVFCNVYLYIARLGEMSCCHGDVQIYNTVPNVNEYVMLIGSSDLYTIMLVCRGA